MKQRRVVALGIAVCAVLAFLWWRYVPARDGEYVIGNAECVWHLVISNGVLTTRSIEHRPTQTRLIVDGVDFGVRVGTARTIGWRPAQTAPGITVNEFAVRDGAYVTARDCTARWLVRGWHSRTFVLQPPTPGYRIRLRFEPDRTGPWIRRQLLLTATGTNVMAVDCADQLAWRCGTAAMGGGRGQPVRIDSAFFAGLEHPASSNTYSGGTLLLQQYPGRRFTRAPLALQSVIVGAGAPGTVDAVLDRYVAQLRGQPRSRTLYNTWCDLREDQLTSSNIHAVATTLRVQCDRHNIPIDTIVVDDGWQDKRSIWSERSDRIDSLARLSASLRARGFAFGLWLPLSGTRLDIAWGASQGYEAACQTYFCMAGAAYNSALRRRLSELIRTSQPAFFKHDFNYFVCGRPEHQHFADDLRSTEANVDALLGLLRLERQRRPGIYLAVTSGLWPSPWWLPYCDTIWMGGKDHDFDKHVPASRGSVFEMNYRDAALYRLLVENTNVFPLSAIMTHGIVDARHTVYDVRGENDEGWANYLMNYLGRGTLMRELYITPANLTERRWDILGRGLRWAHGLDDCMANARFILGNPRLGQIFGYAGGDGTRMYASIRNPQLQSQSFSLADAGLTAALCQIVYPWHEAVPYRPGLQLEAPGEAVMQYESQSITSLSRPVIVGARAMLETSHATTTVYRISPGSVPGDVCVLAPPDLAVRSVISDTCPVECGNDGAWRLRPPIRSADNEDARARDIVVERGPALVAHVTVPAGCRAWLECVLRDAPQAAADIRINDNPGICEWRVGDNWRLMKLPLPTGTNGVRITFSETAITATTTLQVFLASQQTLSSARVTILHTPLRRGVAPALPYPLLQSVARRTVELLPPTRLADHADASAMLSPASVFNAGPVSRVSHGETPAASFPF